MNIDDITNIIQEIVKKSGELKNKYTKGTDASVNYVCIFSHSQKEYKSLLSLTKQLGNVVRETPTGSLFQIAPFDTVAGKLQLLKIRIPDHTRPEKGDADFTVENYDLFKKKYILKSGFKLIKRPQMEMMELMDPLFDVRVYFSHPPLTEQLGL